ncbi:hypothetical protein [uncultured Draconibacterium sp.]|uniref:Cbp1 family collagen-binding glycoprotein adhesin n=1 Tax=uncultured Draconibacterium sp. TaxID=1573823 RepID=UPI0025E3EA4A|nr:hypothetical protein [uncultured Draconibacterium sp.]
MKRILILLIFAASIVSCHNYKKDAEQLITERDSLAQVTAVKDSSIVEFLNDFNDILATLDSIKQVEKLVTVQSARGREMNYRQKQQILEDIQLLNELIQKNKEQLSSLQKKLNSANYKIGNLNAMVAEFEQLVQKLEKQVSEKDMEIVELSREVQNLTRNINQLNQKITVIETESAEKTQTIEQQKMALNKAFYVVGSAKELKENGVVERTGGMLGIGRTSTIKEDFNKEAFTEIDIRELNYVPLNVKKATVISVHPAGSFYISGEKAADTLFVENKVEFWKASKYLVIVLD